MLKACAVNYSRRGLYLLARVSALVAAQRLGDRSGALGADLVVVEVEDLM